MAAVRYQCDVEIKQEFGDSELREAIAKNQIYTFVHLDKKVARKRLNAKKQRAVRLIREGLAVYLREQEGNVRATKANIEEAKLKAQKKINYYVQKYDAEMTYLDGQSSENPIIL